MIKLLSYIQWRRELEAWRRVLIRFLNHESKYICVAIEGVCFNPLFWGLEKKMKRKVRDLAPSDLENLRTVKEHSGAAWMFGLKENWHNRRIDWIRDRIEELGG